MDGYVPKTAWGRFWFQPTDPTTLGFMRIVTGLLVLYIHLAYCFDFKEFFGANAWTSTVDVNRERKESPVFLAPFGWKDYIDYENHPTIPTPQLVDRRAAVFDFLKSLPENKAQRDADLDYLYFMLERFSRADQISTNNYYEGLMLLKRSAPFLDEQRARMEAGLAQEALDVKNLPLTPPDFFLQMTPEERVRLWKSSQRLLTVLPANETNFNYVLEWLLELRPFNFAQRADLAKYLHSLKDGPEARRSVEYYETWRQDPERAFDHGRYVFSVWFHVNDPATMWFCHALVLIVIVLFTLGAFTRVTSVLVWLAALFYIHRSQQILFGMDTMMNVLLFYLMIGPSGAALSVDRLIARWRASRALYLAGGHSVPWAEAVLAGPRPSSLANFAIRLIQIHFCFIYMSSGLSKLKGTMWWDTTATWYTIANPEFCPMQYRAYEWVLLQIASIRPLLLIVFAGVTYFTLVLEIALPFLVWTRMRPYVVIGAILLHSGIAWVMGLTCFGLLMMTLLLCYVPSSVVRERLTWTRGTPTMAVRFNSRNVRHRRLVNFLRTFDMAGQLAFHDETAANGGDGNSVQLIGEDGKARNGFALYLYAWKSLVLLNLIGWLLWVPGVSMLIRWLLGVPGETSTIGKAPPSIPGLGKKPAAR
jgi:hypothetical protein